MKQIHIIATINDAEPFDLGIHEIPDDADPKEWFGFKVEVSQTDFKLDCVFIEIEE